MNKKELAYMKEVIDTMNSGDPHLSEDVVLEELYRQFRRWYIEQTQRTTEKKKINEHSPL